MPSSPIIARRILGKPFNAQAYRPKPRLLAAGDIDQGGVQLDDSLDPSSEGSDAQTASNIYPSPYTYDEMGRGTDTSVGGDSAVSSDKPAPITGPSKGADPSTSIDVPFFGGSKPDLGYDRTSPGQPPMGGGMAPGTASPSNPSGRRVGIPIPGYNTSGGAFESGGAGGAGGPGTGPISRRFEDMASNPDAYGADPKSNTWRRLLGGLVDTAGTWGSMFGVPRNLTHHLAEDVRYGADAAHQKENYYQNLPLLQAAAGMEEKNRQLDEQTQYRLQQQNSLNLYRDQQNDVRQENARTAAERAAPGWEPAPTAAPPITSSTPMLMQPPPPPRASQATADPMGNLIPPNVGGNVPSTAPPLSLPTTVGGMTAQQQIKPGYVPGQLPPAVPGGQPTQIQRPTPAKLDEMKAEAEGRALIDTPKPLIDEGYPVKMSTPEVVRAIQADLTRNDKPVPNKNKIQAYIDAAGGDTSKGLADMHRDAMAEKSVNNFNFGLPGSGGTLDKLTRYTKGNRQYIDGTGVTGKNLLQLQSAAPQGIPVLNKDGVGTIQANGAVNSTLDDMMNQIQSKLPKDAAGRITVGTGNKLSQYFQTDKDLSSFNSWQLDAIQMIRAMGMNRLNQKELESAVDAMPKITDTIGTAQQKVKNVKKMFQNKEDELFKGMNPPSSGGENKPIVQKSPSTGQYRHSLDGGQTWLPGQPQ